ncbi:hypothetical protein BDZ45DRAFT_769759 [Acephala macrosclerotiorum]|nr:hypothetical protein BDZ45DRAFT_769759 [Acephala macrosclerotiorum]
MITAIHNSRIAFTRLYIETPTQDLTTTLADLKMGIIYIFANIIIFAVVCLVNSMIISHIHDRVRGVKSGAQISAPPARCREDEEHRDVEHPPCSPGWTGREQMLRLGRNELFNERKGIENDNGAWMLFGCYCEDCHGVELRMNTRE